MVLKSKSTFPQYNSHIQIILSESSNLDKDIVFVKKKKYYIE